MLLLALSPSALTLSPAPAASGVRVSEGAASSIDSGARIWDAGLALSMLLSSPALAGKRVLELGSGTGVGGLSAAAAGAQVVCSDADEECVLPLLEENIAANGLSGRCRVAKLVWGCEDDEECVLGLEGAFDLICGSDVLYAPNAFDALLSTLVTLSTPGETEVMLTYPTRYTESIFLEEAAAHFETLETFEVEGAGVENVYCTRLRRLPDAEEFSP